MSGQATIQHAIAARLAQEGMDRALEYAEQEIPKWADLAFDFIKRYAPANEKAWGGPIKKAAAKGIIARDGQGKDPYRHGNMIPVWRSLIFQVPAL